MSKIIVARNPARKRSSKRRTAAQKRATAKMIAANRRRRSGSRASSRPRRRKNRATARRRAPSRRRSAPRRRSNPIRGPRGIMGMVNRNLMPAIMGGAGAVANDVLFNFAIMRLPVPVTLQTGPMRYVGKAASALGMSWLASFFLTRRQADQLGAGALTVIGYQVVRDLVARFAPSVQMGEYLAPAGMGYYGAGLNPGYYGSSTMGEYLAPQLAQVPGTGVSVPRQLAQGTPFLGQYESDPIGYDYEL